MLTSLDHAGTCCELAFLEYMGSWPKEGCHYFRPEDKQFYRLDGGSARENTIWITDQNGQRRDAEPQFLRMYWRARNGQR